MKWAPIAFGGKIYDLSHLHPTYFEVFWPAKGAWPEKRISVAVEYSMHCFTVGRTRGQPGFIAELQYADSREVRQFDFERYEHSKQLQVVMVAFADGGQRCYQSPHRNYFTAIPHPDGVTLDKRFCIYFRLGRRERKDADLTLFVESAYCKEPPNTARVRPCSFKELCGRVLRK